MSGILKAIQKKPGRENLSAHSLPSIVSDDSGSYILENLQRDQAEQLLDELMTESAEADGSRPTRVVRRGPKAGISRKSSPSNSEDKMVLEWERRSSKLPPHLETALLEAIQTVNYEIRKMNSLPKELETLAKNCLSGKFGAEGKGNWKDQDLITKEVLSLLSLENVLGALIADDDTTEIFIDSHQSIKARRKDQLVETPFCFRNVDELELFAAALLLSTGYTLGVEQPILDCVIDKPERMFVNAVHQSLTGTGEPRISIRIPRLKKVSFYDLLQGKVLPGTLAAWLAEAVSQGDVNILIVGQSARDRCLLISALASEMGSDERVIAVEEIPQIQSSSINLEKLISKPGITAGSVSAADLVRTALRRTPERLLLSELKGSEASEYIQALECGMTGCIAAINGDYPEDGLWRLLDLLLVHEHSPQITVMRRIARSTQLVISLQTFDGKPCIVEIAEVQPLEGLEFQVLPLVQLESIEDGRRSWRIMTNSSYWLEKIADRGGVLRSGPGLLPFKQGWVRDRLDDVESDKGQLIRDTASDEVE